jgi:hypothetical protein
MPGENMTTKKNTPEASAAADESAAAPAPVFRDRKFTSRILILPEGRTAKVIAGTIVATTDELLAVLDQHEDFERIPE